MPLGTLIPELCGSVLTATPAAPRPIGPLGELRVMLLWSLMAAGLLITFTVVMLVLRRLHTHPAPPRRERDPLSRVAPISAWVEAGKRVRVAPLSNDDEDEDHRDDTVDIDPDDLGPGDIGGPRGGRGG